MHRFYFVRVKLRVTLVDARTWISGPYNLWSIIGKQLGRPTCRVPIMQWSRLPYNI